MDNKEWEESIKRQEDLEDKIYDSQMRSIKLQSVFTNLFDKLSTEEFTKEIGEEFPLPIGGTKSIRLKVEEGHCCDECYFYHKRCTITHKDRKLVGGCSGSHFKPMNPNKYGTVRDDLLIKTPEIKENDKR